MKKILVAKLIYNFTKNITSLPWNLVCVFLATNSIPGFSNKPLTFILTKQLYSQSFQLKHSRLKYALSPNYKAFVYGALMSKQGRYVVMQGEAGKHRKISKKFKRFDGIRGDFHFSPNGKRLAYIAYTSAGYSPSETDCFLVLDNVAMPQYSNVFMSGFKFSPDSKRYAFIAGFYPYIKALRYSIVVDGKSYGPYDAVDSVNFSADSKRFSFRASMKKKWFVVVDGIKGKNYSFVSAPAFSSDNKKVLYIATFANKKQMWVLNGKEGRLYDDVRGAIFSSDSKSIAFSASSNLGSFVILNGKRSKVYSNASIRHLVFSPNSKSLAFVVNSTQGYKAMIVVDNKEGSVFPGFVADYPVFSPDGKRLAVIVMQIKKQSYVVVDGKRLPQRILKQPDSAGPNIPLVFSPDSKQLSYRVSEASQQFLMVDGKEHKGFKGGVSKQFYSPDSKLVVYIGTKNGKDYLVINNQPIGPFNFIQGRQRKFSFYFGRSQNLYNTKYPHTENKYIRFIDNRTLRIFTKEKNGDIYKVTVKVN